MIDTQLLGKTVLITGANNPYGIGAATARAFAKQGAKVLISYLRLSPENFGITSDEAKQAKEAGEAFYQGMRMKSAEEIVKPINDDGGWAKAFEANLLDEAHVTSLFTWAEAEAGHIDILINNASHYSNKDTSFNISNEQIQKTFGVNVGGTLLMSKKYIRGYQSRNATEGCIINLSTDAAQTFAGQITYGSSKAAIEALTRSMAIELGELGIRVNAIAPGPTQTGYISKEVELKVVNDIPLRRLGMPDEVADVAVFLASYQARWLTGQVIKVSGGHSL
ncbi:MAG: SDR family oxidoreductase [Deinococcota bacterium]